MAASTQYATGKRKSAIARAWVTAAAGDIVVNEKPLEKAFPRLTLRKSFNFRSSWRGRRKIFECAPRSMAVVRPDKREPSGMRSPKHWSSSVRHIVAPSRRKACLTRDSRVKERKKYGQKGARKRFQYSKR